VSGTDINKLGNWKETSAGATASATATRHYLQFQSASSLLKRGGFDTDKHINLRAVLLPPNVLIDAVLGHIFVDDNGETLGVTGAIAELEVVRLHLVCRRSYACVHALLIHPKVAVTRTGVTAGS
jgi:hypothetical protein